MSNHQTAIVVTAVLLLLAVLGLEWFMHWYGRWANGFNIKPGLKKNDS